MSHRDRSSARRAHVADNRARDSDAAERARKGPQRMPGGARVPPGADRRRVPWEIDRVRARPRTRTRAVRPRTDAGRSHLLGGDLLEQSGLDLAAGAERAHAGGDRRSAGGAAQSGQHRERARWVVGRDEPLRYRKGWSVGAKGARPTPGPPRASLFQSPASPELPPRALAPAPRPRAVTPRESSRGGVPRRALDTSAARRRSELVCARRFAPHDGRMAADARSWRAWGGALRACTRGTARRCPPGLRFRCAVS